MIGVKKNRLRKTVLTCAAVCLSAVIPAAIVGQDAKAVLMNTAKAMGVENTR
jgi:hypothetical protein